MLTDLEFLKVIWVSDTFRESMFDAGLFLTILLIITGISLKVLSRSKLKARKKIRFSLNRDETGSANAADFVLILPFFMFMMCLFVQLAMLVNASLIVHYAAYSAARTASVHFCNRSVLSYRLGYLGCDSKKAEAEAIKAARYVLIAASPADNSIQSNGNPPNESLQWLADEYLERKSPILIQARYAYDSRNVVVQVKPASSTNLIIQGQYVYERIPSEDSIKGDKKLLNTWPVTARVEYVKHLGVPLVAPFLSNVRRGNDHFRTIEAEITLL